MSRREEAFPEDAAPGRRKPKSKHLDATTTATPIARTLRARRRMTGPTICHELRNNARAQGH
eukprot:CAMPEP_0115487212 /NCGR_PEP_ID=MMETSP0271-20121206/60836_1 /TAXON_ID=71861 /ORGANISM="Scrippsiella trochoidea, Strain CCMP3099" /LENGTH=61 /DNA_ID=CAMNT_0002915249 /DNA_START=33 /DNA_END=215 /DNA_ORIENTATION=-